MFEKLIPYDAAHLILVEYFKYYHKFQRITKRAKIRFENRDWIGIQEDGKDRIELYRTTVGATTIKLKDLLANTTSDRKIWQEIMAHYSSNIANFNTKNIAETFYNSVFRHYHKGLSSDSELMFVNATSDYSDFTSTVPIFWQFKCSRSTPELMLEILDHYQFDIPYEDKEREVERLHKVFSLFLLQESIQPRRIEILKSIFFRNKGAYIVGRLISQNKVSPFIISLLNPPEGIKIDALLLNYNDVSSIFSFNRSYFLVELDIARETIDFLVSVLPTKSTDELYNSIGFDKHGKTVFYRNFLRHLHKSTDQYIIAPGVQGMVMFVFTMPSHNMVFKVIRDKFAPPKNVTQQEVKEKYALVNTHDRVGRMTDSHMFENLVFNKARFEPRTLQSLQEAAPSKVRIRYTEVEIEHLYVEKKMIPLDIYLKQATLEEAEEVIDDYGKAIKQMAAANIFPGDMLLKNFGVTRLNRVVFYDYDEIGFLTDFNFRRLPEARDDFDEFSREPFFHVKANDIFPEEFPKFLIGHPEIKQIFFKLHGDLYSVEFWRNMQKKLQKGELIDVYPYPAEKRFQFIFKDF